MDYIFPYTNFSDVNLDWILNVIKTLSETVEDSVIKLDAAIATLTQLEPIVESLQIDKADIITEEISNNVVWFRDGAVYPAKKLYGEILGYQTGSGTPDPLNVRPIVGYDGITIFNDPIYGGFLNWNQLVKNGDFETASEWATTSTTYSVTDNVATIVSSANWGRISQKVLDTRTAGRKYLISAEVKADSANLGKNIRIGVCKSDTSELNYVAKTLTTAWETVSLIINNTFSSEGYFIIGASNNAVTFDVRNAQFFDLTEMFGAGNEPTTVADFRTIFPNAFYDFNAGEITNASAVNGTPFFQKYVMWNDVAGTVYNGWINLTEGVLYVTSAEIDSYNGETINEPWVSSMDPYTPGGTPTIGSQVVYSLDTPVEYHITPEDFIMLFGTNNVWNDTGGDTLVEYRADTKLYIYYPLNP